MSDSRDVRSEERPAFDEMVLSEDNVDFFIVWAATMCPPTVDELALRTLLDINIPDWIAQNNVRWTYAYAWALDSIKMQREIEKALKEKSMKPTDPLVKRKLLASFYEEEGKSGDQAAVPSGVNTKLRGGVCLPQDGI